MTIDGPIESYKLDVVPDIPQELAVLKAQNTQLQKKNGLLKTTLVIGGIGLVAWMVWAGVAYRRKQKKQDPKRV